MTAAQEPRAGEVLTAESVKLLRAGDVLRARSSFHNPDILTKRDIVIVQSIGYDASISFQNLFRASPPCGLTANRFVFVHRPPIRLRADYSHMVSRPSESSASVGGEALDRIEFILTDPAPGYSARVANARAYIAALRTQAPAREGEAWRPVSEYTGCGPVLVSTAPDSPKYLASDPVTAFLDVGGTWRCLGSIGGNAELAQKPTHFAPMPARPALSRQHQEGEGR